MRSGAASCSQRDALTGQRFRLARGLAYPRSAGAGRMDLGTSDCRRQGPADEGVAKNLAICAQIAHGLIDGPSGGNVNIERAGRMIGRPGWQKSDDAAAKREVAGGQVVRHGWFSSASSAADV